MRAKVLACLTMADEVRKVIPPEMELDLLPYALHRTPDQLKTELQKRIDAATTHSIVLLVYGLCSYGVANLHSDRHTIVIPRVQDCISLLLGGRDIYSREFEKYPGTYYLSKGWIDQGADPYAQFKRYLQQYGEENAQWLIDTQYRNYQRVVFIHTGVGDPDYYSSYARKGAEFIHVVYEECQGSQRLLEKLFSEQWDGEFVVTEPGRMVTQRDFLEQNRSMVAEQTRLVNETDLSAARNNFISKSPS